MHRIALFSDVHGNSQALDAVLADIDGAGVDEVYCLGDLVGYGPDPSGVIARVRARGIETIRGNYDDGIGNRAGSCGCYYATPEAEANGAASYEFTAEALGDAELDWLAALPDVLWLERDGVRILLAHGSPRRINEYLLPDRTDDLLLRLADEVDADVVCVGHVHLPYHRALTAPDGSVVHYVSDGSVGKPKDGDPRAQWVELVLGDEDEVAEVADDDPALAPIGSSWVTLGIRIHRIDYGVDAVAEQVIEVGLPPALAEALREAR